VPRGKPAHLGASSLLPPLLPPAVQDPRQNDHRAVRSASAFEHLGRVGGPELLLPCGEADQHQEFDARRGGGGQERHHHGSQAPRGKRQAPDHCPCGCRMRYSCGLHRAGTRTTKCDYWLEGVAKRALRVWLHRLRVPHWALVRSGPATCGHEACQETREDPCCGKQR
ncbi:unnamed protein product, partial [Symbiodinium necroappetens]